MPITLAAILLSISVFYILFKLLEHDVTSKKPIGIYVAVVVIAISLIGSCLHSCTSNDGYTVTEQRIVYKDVEHKVCIDLDGKQFILVGPFIDSTGKSRMERVNLPIPTSK